MAVAQRTDTVLRMDASEIGRGAAIEARRLGLGWHAKDLAERAGISRDTLAKVEDDAEGVRPQTYAKIERALDELDEELGPESARAGLEVTMRDVYGIGELSIISPSQDPDVVAEAVLKIIEGLKERQ